MNLIDGSYANSQYYNNTVQQNQKKNADEAKSKTSKESETVTQTNKASQSRLSSRAQAYLETLRKTYNNMDFMVADFNKGDDAKEILSRGTKEISVLFSSEELERMASDENYAKEYMNRVQGAVRMSEQINQQFGFESSFGKISNKAEITKIGISFNKDGSMSIFAELEKAMDKQKEHIEKVREKRAEEKRAAVRKEESNKKNRVSAKKTTIHASSADDLLKKISEIDWNNIREDKRDESNRFDVSI